MIKWFSLEFQKATGLNILSQPFDVQNMVSWVHGKTALIWRYGDMAK